MDDELSYVSEITVIGLLIPKAYGFGVIIHSTLVTNMTHINRVMNIIHVSILLLPLDILDIMITANFQNTGRDSDPCVLPGRRDARPCLGVGENMVSGFWF